MRFILDWDLNMTGFHSCIITPPEGLIQYITRHICPAANRRPSMTKPIRIRNTRKLCLVMNALFANMVYNWRTLQSLDWLYLLFTNTAISWLAISVMYVLYLTPNPKPAALLRLHIIKSTWTVLHTTLTRAMQHVTWM